MIHEEEQINVEMTDEKIRYICPKCYNKTMIRMHEWRPAKDYLFCANCKCMRKIKWVKNTVYSIEVGDIILKGEA